MDEFRYRVRMIILFIGSLFGGVLLLRLFLKLLGASSGAPIVNVFYQLSQPLLAPFTGIAGVRPFGSGANIFEPDTLVAAMMWIAIFFIIAEIVTAFMYDSLGEILFNLVDAFFKFVEFFLLTRFIMRLIGVQTGINPFVDIVYGIAGIVYAPFAGIAPGIAIGNGVLEISTLIALIIVVLLDLFAEGFFRALLGVKTDDESPAPKS